MVDDFSPLEVVYGLSDSNLTILCENMKFRVHRDVISQASEVWNIMLNGGFAESFSDQIILSDDDPNAVKQALDILYGQMSGQIIFETFSADLEVFLHKYSLIGVSKFILNAKNFLLMEQHLVESALQLEQVAVSHKAQLLRLKKLHEGEISFKVMRPGMFVNYEDKPPLDTRVVETSKPFRTGKIIANDEDGGTEIGVAWDRSSGGGESHHLWCGKKKTNSLTYL
eukprot:gene9396-12655_t